MKLTLTIFGITKEIIGKKKLEYPLSGQPNIEALKKSLYRDFPELRQLASMAIAVNGSYAGDHQEINANDEIVLIPPVSGG